MPSLWAVQSKLLLTFFNAFNGKPSDIQVATEDMTFLQKVKHAETLPLLSNLSYYS